MSSSVASSGFYSGHSERDDPSPPHPLSESAPATFNFPRRSDLASDSDTRDTLLSGYSEQVGVGEMRLREYVLSVCGIPAERRENWNLKTLFYKDCSLS